jgi:hypothetical protein
MDWGSLYALSIGGTSRTADSIGAGFVDHELDAAAIAEVRVRGAMPAVGAAVAISGVVATAFAGVVDRVDYDPAPDQRCWVVRCTDNLQAYFEALGAASVAAGNHVSVGVVAALPSGAYWHEALFSVATDGWEACQDAMNCVPASIWLSGGMLQSASWQPGASAHTIAHSAGGIYDGSVRLDMAGVRDLVNQVVMAVDIQYTRLHQWRLTVGWAGPDIDFCDNYANAIGWPSRNLIAEAVAGNSWTLLATGALSSGEGNGISGERLWPSGDYTCGGGPVVWINRDDADNHLINASWKMGRRWAQTVRESYTVTVTGTGAAGSVENDGFGYEFPADDGWDASTPSTNKGTFAASSDGWQVSGAHDWIDLRDTDTRDDLLSAAIRMAATRIRRSQRGSTMAVTVLPAAEPALGTWCTITADGVSGFGQVARLRAAWDFDSHQAGCEVAIILTSGTMAADALTPPAAPDVSPTAGGYTLSATHALGSHVGGEAGSPAQDDDWDGWVTNRQAPASGSETYSGGFTVTTPDVPDEAREEQVGTQTAAYAIDPLDGSPTF